MKHEKKLVGSIQPEIDALEKLIEKCEGAKGDVEYLQRVVKDIQTYRARIAELETLKKLNKGAKDSDLCEI